MVIVTWVINWQDKIPAALSELHQFRSVVIEADKSCFQQSNKEACKDSLAKLKPIGEKYVETSQSLNQELTKIIDYGKSLGLN